MSDYNDLVERLRFMGTSITASERTITYCTEAAAAIASLLAERDEARKQLSELRRDVEEWCCEKCRMVYPGPPQPGVMCVICPQCGGATAPLVTVELLAALAERDAAIAERDDLLAGRANDDREYAKLIVERDGLRDNRFVLNRALAIAAADLESFGHHHAASAARAAIRGGSDGKEGKNG